MTAISDESKDSYARNSRDSATIPNLHFYRQPGGCVEASDQGSEQEEVDILHFCSDDEARTFIREFAQFINDTPAETL